MEKKIIIAASILSADFRRLGQEVLDAQNAGADRIHCDVMDGTFVNNITFGPLVIEAVRSSVRIPLDVHLMIVNPEKYLNAFCDAGANILMFHAEATENIPSALEKIKKRNVKSGVAVNPDKPLELFFPYLELIDQVLIMTVFAGLPAQKFMPSMLDKIALMRNEIVRRGLNIDIEVDGGINETSVQNCARCGANVFVAGSYIFGSNDYSGRINSLRRLAIQGIREA